MANWGLLGGLGAGLSQFGATLNQGLNADIAAKQREDIETRREASIEKRWAKQEARANRQEQAQSERWAKQDERQENQDIRQRERDEVSDSQFDQRSIERNLSGVMDKANKAAEDIEKRYEKLKIDSLGQPLPKAQLIELEKEKKKEMKSVKTQYASLVDNYVKSYGDKLRGTGFAYLLDVPDIEEVTEKKDPPPGSQGSNVNDLATKILRGESNADLEAELLKRMPYPENISNIKRPTSGVREPTFLNAAADSLGGDYNYDAKPISNDRSPFEEATTFTGGLLTYAPGKFLDSLENINDKVIQPAWDWASTKPSQRK